MRSAKFTAPEKEVEKPKIVQLDQNTVNKRVADFVTLDSTQHTQVSTHLGQ